jgi:MFS family permease
MKDQTIAKGLAFSCLFLDVLLLVVPTSFLSIVFKAQGRSSFEAGVVFGSASVVSLLVGPFSGWIVNSCGVRAAMLVGCGIIGGSSLLFALSPIDNYALVLTSRALQVSRLCFSAALVFVFARTVNF